MAPSAFSVAVQRTGEYNLHSFIDYGDPEMKVIKAADILLPAVEDMGRWSVIACDQFTSDRGYWDETRRFVGEAPSTLKMILPEVFIGTAEAENAGEKIAGYMKSCLEGKLFRTLPDSFMFVERSLGNGAVRHGIVAAVDLEAYEYKPEKDAVIKATEHTVEERLHKRIELRGSAPLELPHVIIFYADPDDTLIKKLSAEKAQLHMEYDFELMQGGGSICGWSVSGEKAAVLELSLNKMAGTCGSLAVGDGNHSLATAKLCWDRMKQGLIEAERETHCARYALAELVNVYDSGIRIEPIHRVISGSEVSGFGAFAEKRFRALEKHGAERRLTIGSASGERSIAVTGLTVAQLIDAADGIIAEYLDEHSGAVDYVHDDASAVEAGSRPGCAYILLPAVERKDIFEVVRRKELFPKKSFSIGNAREKRYYLECRKIR